MVNLQTCHAKNAQTGWPPTPGGLGTQPPADRDKCNLKLRASHTSCAYERVASCRVRSPARPLMRHAADLARGSAADPWLPSPMPTHPSLTTLHASRTPTPPHATRPTIMFSSATIPGGPADATKVPAPGKRKNRDTANRRATSGLYRNRCLSPDYRRCVCWFYVSRTS